MYGLEIQKEDIISLKELILKEENKIDKKVTNIKSVNERDKRENNDIKILDTCS